MTDQRVNSLPRRISGFRSRPINGLIDYLDARETGRVRGGAADTPRATRLFLRPFDLGPVLRDTFQVLDRGGRESAVWFKGIKITVGDGAGMTWDGTDRWDATAISASSWVYLLWDTTDMGVDIVLASSLPDGTDNTEIWPLWYIPWTTVDSVGMIQEAGIIDMRYGWHVPGLAV